MVGLYPFSNGCPSISKKFFQKNEDNLLTKATKLDFVSIYSYIINKF